MVGKWTEEEVQFLQDNKFKMDNAELAEKLGRSVKSVKRKLYMLRNPKPSSVSLYEVLQGYEVIAAGTADECAEQLGVSKPSIYRYASEDYLRGQRDLENALVAFKIERDEMLERFVN